MIGNLGITETLCALGIIFTGIWYYLTANYSYWKELGVPGPEPSIIVGNLKEMVLLRRSFSEVVKGICKEYPEAPMVGIYHFRKPLLLLRDLELIKDVLIKDFTNFSERSITFNEKLEPLDAHLFNLETKRWRALRSRLSPVFTSGKIKHMFALMMECAEYFEKCLDTVVEEDETVDCREIAGRFTTDVIGSCAFGLNINALADEESEFRKMGKLAFASGYRARLLITLRGLAPWFYSLLGMAATPPEVTRFFTSTMKQTLEYREKNNIRRGDLIDILMDMKGGPQTPDLELTDTLLTAQAFVFFIAGFETSATTISHALLEIAQKPDVQEKLRQEIIDSLQNNDEKISYESVKEMKYLHMVFQETLRLRPPIAVHLRKAINDYTFRGTNVTIRKGQVVWIPVVEIQDNPKYYPNPKLFDPERFTEDMVKSRHPMTYLPFGDGPRNCIGARFAVYQTKLALIKIFSKYKVEISEKMQLPFQPEPKVFLLQPVGGVHLKFSKLDKPR